MKQSTYIWSIIALIILALPAAHDAGREASAVAKPQAVRAYGQLPLSFEANQGQSDQRVKFLSHGRGYSLFLTGDEAVLALKKPVASTARDRKLKPAVPSAEAPAVVRMKLVGANGAAKVTGLGELPGKSNYFIGNDPEKWRTNVPNYAKVKYTGVYPGVDLVYYGNQRQLEYDFVVQPGADPRQIALQLVAPASSQDAAKAKMAALRIDKNGDLVVAAEGGEVIFHKPVVYQPTTDNGQWTKQEKQRTKDKHFVAGNYLLKDDRLTFEIARYDKTRPLVIDPTLAYSTYLGDCCHGDTDSAITVDVSGNAYITGFPFGSNAVAFVDKLDASGSAMVYSTFLGGGGGTFTDGIAVDASGNAYVTGSAGDGFPTTPGAFQTTYGGNGDAFVSKLNASGALVYSTYLGGSNFDYPNGIAVDAAGNAYVAGLTYYGGFPTTPGAFQTTYGGGYRDAFVSKLNASGSALVYSTYLGGLGEDEASGIAVDAAGDAYITGQTLGAGFPVTPGAFQTTPSGVEDAFVSKLNASGSALVYSTYLGPTGYEGGGIAADASGNAYVTGSTGYSNFPTTPGAFQTTLGCCSGSGSGDAFVSKLNGAGSALVYSTFLGASDYGSRGVGIAVDASGNAFVTGSTGSPHFPTTQSAFGGSNGGFVTKLNATGSAPLFSTYLGGGNGGGQPNGIAIDAAGNAYVTGITFSHDFPTTPGAIEAIDPLPRVGSGDWTGFVSKFSFGPVTLSPNLDFGAQLINTTSSPKSVTLTNTGDATLDISSIGITGPSGNFSETSTCGSSLLAGASCSIAVTFRPTGTNSCAETGYLTVESASGGLGTVMLSGAGSVVSLSVKSLNFGNQAVGTTSAAKTITLTNHATSRVVTIAAVSISGPNSPSFAQTNTCGTSLAAGASCTLSVTFTPHGKGSKAATLNVWNNGGAAALKVTLTGNGT